MDAYAVDDSAGSSGKEHEDDEQMDDPIHDAELAYERMETMWGEVSRLAEQVKEGDEIFGVIMQATQNHRTSKRAASSAAGDRRSRCGAGDDGDDAGLQNPSSPSSPGGSRRGRDDHEVGDDGLALDWAKLPEMEASFVQSYEPKRYDKRMLQLLGSSATTSLMQDYDRVYEHFHARLLALDRHNISGKRAEERQKEAAAEKAKEKRKEKGKARAEVDAEAPQQLGRRNSQPKVPAQQALVRRNSRTHVQLPAIPGAATTDASPS